MKTMKNIVLSIILSLSVFSAWAAADSRIINGNAAYSNNKFEEAISQYEDLLKTQESAALYYNLGKYTIFAFLFFPLLSLVIFIFSSTLIFKKGKISFQKGEFEVNSLPRPPLCSAKSLPR